MTKKQKQERLELRARNSLGRVGRQLQDASTMTDAELLMIPRLGVKQLEWIRTNVPNQAIADVLVTEINRTIAAQGFGKLTPRRRLARTLRRLAKRLDPPRGALSTRPGLAFWGRSETAAVLPFSDKDTT